MFNSTKNLVASGSKLSGDSSFHAFRLTLMSMSKFLITIEVESFKSSQLHFVETNFLDGLRCTRRSWQCKVQRDLS